jgi:L-lactate dehydrogenase complex protein LldG
MSAAGSDSRAAILGRLKQGLKRDGRPTDAARQRLETPPTNLVPKRGIDAADKIKQFTDEAERVEATVQRIAGLADLPAAVADYLKRHNLPTQLRVAPSLQSAGWASQPLLDVASGRAAGTDAVGVSRAFGGVAETGTLVFLSGPDNPTTVNFLPPTHIAVVTAGDIAGSYEEVWARVRALQPRPGAGKTQLPRTVNWITGPSRTADIEQTLLLGAHGPQNLHIVVVDDAG